MEYFAHGKNESGQYESLIHHLKRTAHYAEQFGNDFDSGKICRQLGLLHDVGKHTKAFQDVLFHKNDVHKIDHAIAGGQILFQKEYGVLSDFYVAYLSSIIASHHSDLYCAISDLIKFVANPNYADRYIRETDKTNAVANEKEFEEIKKYVSDNKLLLDISEQDLLKLPELRKSNTIPHMLYIRMLFSCLVDADYTATAEWENIDYYSRSEPYALNPEQMIIKLSDYRNEIIRNSDQDAPINRLRNRVYDCCTKKGGSAKKKVYTLNAPTGTAKTLALMNFALRCARRNNQKRIFIVLPYLSIISQNAEVYRDVFGEHIVLEDDSSVEYTEETKLYSERWSSPIIVTTSVKFFESMFKSKASECRRLHQIANSVIVFDECQTLPNSVLNTTLTAISELPERYGSTVLFSTATLPVYQYRKGLESFESEEIIDNPLSLFKSYSCIKNTAVITDTRKTYDEESLVDLGLMSSYRQKLYIFNTVKKAKKMYQKLVELYREEAVFLITSQMCSMHKLDIIQKVKSRLKNGQDCYLAGTQAVEIGVDIDFPCLAREFAPIDSLIQSAGRVNRNCKSHAVMFIYRHSDDTEPGTEYEEFSRICMRFADGKYQDKFDLNNLDLMNDCYKEMYTYDVGNKDKESLVKALNDCNSSEWFSEVNDEYKLIEDSAGVSVIVPYEKCLAEYSKLREMLAKQNGCIKKAQMKQCVPYCIHLRKSKNTKEILNSGCIQLCAYTPGRKRIPIDWWVADEDMYDQSGLHEKYSENFIF